MTGTKEVKLKINTMSQETNHSRLLGVIAGTAGDVYIGVEAVTDKKFSLIEIGPDGATVTVAKIRGVDVVTARGYGALPAGYQMIAGGDDYFDAVTLTAGSAQGVLYPEPISPVIDTVVVAAGAINDPMVPEITFDNAGGSGSVPLRWRLKDPEGAVIETGETKIYFLNGSDVEVTIPGLTYPDTADDGYVFEINITDSDEAWIASAAFEVTSGA